MSVVKLFQKNMHLRKNPIKLFVTRVAKINFS